MPSHRSCRSADGFAIVINLALLALSVIAFPSAANARQATNAAFQPGFHLRGVNGEVHASAVFGDGLEDGDAGTVYVGGSFDAIGPTYLGNIARLSAGSFAPVGDGLDGPVRDMKVAQVPAGAPAALYAVGAFQHSGDIALNHVAKWDGERWSPLGAGLHFAPAEIHQHTDAQGATSLYACRGGGSTLLYRWDGSVWSRVDTTGLPDGIEAIATMEIGGEPTLVVGLSDVGFPITRGSVYVQSSGSWTRLGSEFPWAVYALTVFDDGSGVKLYAGGLSVADDDVPTDRLARWDGSEWEPVGGPVSGSFGWILNFAAVTENSVPVLYAMGDFDAINGVQARGIARWNGKQWTALDAGTRGFVYTMTPSDAGLLIGGSFVDAGATAASGLAAFRTGEWRPLVDSGQGISRTVRTTAVFDHRLYAAVYNYSPLIAASAGSAVTSPFGAFIRTANDWEVLDVPGICPGCPIDALHTYDDGKGDALFVVGEDGATQFSKSVIRYDGASSSLIGAADNAFLGGVLQGFTEKGVPGLYAVSFFPSINGVSLNGAGVYREGEWRSAGSITLTYQSPPYFSAAAVFDAGDGAGPRLYAGGFFTIPNDRDAYHILRWTGKQWESVGRADEPVYALAVWNGALYAGGRFTTVDGMAASLVARFDGQTWSPLGTGLSGASVWTQHVAGFAVFDDGSGPALFAAGDFTTAGDQPARAIAKWTGTTWEPVSTGVDGVVTNLTVFNDASGSSLYVFGAFTHAGPHISVNVAEYARPGSVCPADFNHSGTVDSQDFFDYVTAFFAIDPTADFNADGAINTEDFFDFITAYLTGC